MAIEYIIPYVLGSENQKRRVLLNQNSKPFFLMKEEERREKFVVKR